MKPLHFYYQVNAKPSQTAVKKISSASEETDCKRKVAHGSRAEKLPGGACLKRVITNNRQNVKVKGVICSSVNKKASKAAVKKVKSPAGECLASQIPKASSRECSFSAETLPISVETKELDEKSDLKDNCRRKEDCDSQDWKAAEVSLDEQNRVKSVRDLDSKEMQMKSSERNSIELTESEVTDIEVGPKTSSRTVENETPKPSPNQKKSGLADCSPSADSALSPSRPETVSQLMTVDGFDTMSDAEGNAIDSASSPPPPTKRMKMAEPNDRNLFAAINSMIVNSNNDNVVSSSTSSQASTDDSGDNKTSVETQTSAKLIGRCSKKGKPRTKKDSIVKSRSMKQIDCNDHARVLPPTSAASVVALSADTSSQSISVATHTYSTAVDTTTQQCTSATLCVPICINDKTGGGSNLILNLPQNVSVQCRIRSDKILIASNPTATAANPDVASSTFSSISYNQTTTISAKSPVPPVVQSRPSPSLTSEASPVLTSQVSPCLTSEASPTVTSQAALAVKSPAQPIMASSGQPNRSSITRSSLAAPSMTSSVAPNVKSSQLSDDNRIASPLPRQLDTRTITENNGNVCNNRVTSAGECQASGKEVPVKRGAVKWTVNTSDTSLRFRNKDRCHDCLGEVPVQSTNPGKSETVSSASTCVSPSPVRCAIPITRSPETVPLIAASLAKPPCESNVNVVASKTTCPKSALGQKEATVTKVPCCATATNRDVDPIRGKTPQNVAPALKQNRGPTNVCKTISRPKEVVPPATTSVVSANSFTAPTSSGVSTTKAVLFKPYQITTTTTSHVTSPKRSVDGITATATFQSNAHHSVLYSNPTFPMFPNFQYPKDQPALTHQADISKAYCCMMRDSVLASTASCEMTKSGMPAVHRTMSNIPLHSVIKVPTYTARKMPQNKKSEKKGSRSPRNESSSTPIASVSILRKPESSLGSQETLGQKGGLKVDEVEGKLIDCPVSDYVREMSVSKGSQGGDRKVALQATTPKGIQDDLTHGKVDEGWNQLTASSSSIRSCLKLPLVRTDILDKGDSSPCSISTSSLNEPSALPTYDSETVPKIPLTKKRFDLPSPSSSGSDHRHSPKRRSEKTCPTDEMSYTCAEADSGTSPGAVSFSPPRCGSKNDTPPGGLSPNLLQQSSATGSSLRKKLVIDLERCSPRQGKASSGANCTPSPSVSTSFDQRLHCCSPTTTTIPPADPPLSGGQTTPPRLVISLPRCQIPAPTTLLSPSGGCQSQWSPTSSGTDNSPPTTKRLKLMCNGMTIYRTLESPGSRSPRRTSGGGGGSSSRKSSPVSAPAVVDCPLTLLSRASSCKSPSPPQGKCRRKSNSSTPVLSTGMEPKSVVVTGGDPVAVVSVDSTSTSPRTPATTVSLSNDNGLFVMTPWKVHERSSVSVAASGVEEPLELTTKEVKERQKEREYAKLMSNLRPPSAFTT